MVPSRQGRPTWRGCRHGVACSRSCCSCTYWAPSSPSGRPSRSRSSAPWAGRSRSTPTPATRVTHALTSRRVLPIGFTLPITGLAIIAVRGINPFVRESWWLALAIVLYIGLDGYGFFVQSKLVERVVEITSTPPTPGASGPPPELRPLIGRIQRGGIAMGLLIVAIVFLMVVKPIV